MMLQTDVQSSCDKTKLTIQNVIENLLKTFSFMKGMLTCGQLTKLLQKKMNVIFLALELDSKLFHLERLSVDREFQSMDNNVNASLKINDSSILFTMRLKIIFPLLLLTFSGDYGNKLELKQNYTRKFWKLKKIFGINRKFLSSRSTPNANLR